MVYDRCNTDTSLSQGNCKWVKSKTEMALFQNGKVWLWEQTVPKRRSGSTAIAEEFGVVELIVDSDCDAWSLDDRRSRSAHRSMADCV
jgi:hypothetical protein